MCVTITELLSRQVLNVIAELPIHNDYFVWVLIIEFPAGIWSVAFYECSRMFAIYTNVRVNLYPLYPGGELNLMFLPIGHQFHKRYNLLFVMQPFAEVCIQRRNFKEAAKYIVRAAPENRFRLYMAIE